MQLVLTAQETDTLRDLLEAYLPQLRREIARTDHHDMRHALVLREELAERLVEELEHGERKASS
jgi:chemotaxis protein CheY-P-specific phosphatase CheC